MEGGLQGPGGKDSWISWRDLGRETDGAVYWEDPGAWSVGADRAPGVFSPGVLSVRDFTNRCTLSRQKAGELYMAYMGGVPAVLRRAAADFLRGEYHWVAEVLRHAVYAAPDHRDAKELLACTYDALGREAPSEAWRDIYEQSARELRAGREGESAGGVGNGAQLAEALTEKAEDQESCFSKEPAVLSARPLPGLDPSKNRGRRVALNVDFTDIGRSYALIVEDCVLFCLERPIKSADATLRLSRKTLNRIRQGRTTVGKAMAAGALVVEGREEALGEFLSLLDGRREFQSTPPREERR